MDPIDVSISPSIDPGMADAIKNQFIIGQNNDGAPVHHPGFDVGRNILATHYETSVALSEAERNLKAAGLNDPATSDRLRRAATAKMNAARKGAADGLAALQSHVDAISTQIDTDLGIPTARIDVTEAGRASDVRAYIRSLPMNQRAEAVRKAVAEGDSAVAAAVLSASPYACGLSRKDAEGVRFDAEEKFCKASVRMRDSIGKLVGMVETAMAATEQRFGPMCGVGDSPAAKAARSLAALEGGR